MAGWARTNLEADLGDDLQATAPLTRLLRLNWPGLSGPSRPLVAHFDIILSSSFVAET